MGNDEAIADVYTITEKLEKDKLKEAAPRVTEANKLRPADSQVSYFVLVVNDLGTIGQHADALLEGLVRQCRKNTQERGTNNPYTSIGRLKGRLSSVLQSAQADATRARIPKAPAPAKPD